MQFQISTIKDVSCITLEGTLNALDMIFMTQSPQYKTAISSNKKLLLDYSYIDGSILSPEDVVGITMLGKKGLEGSGNTHVAVVVEDSDREDIEKITKAIFSDTQSKIIVTDNKQQALTMLNQA
ncbi:hypothetical protein [Paraglaciecola sp.]|uniref:hypothetical protein n=1 Tax=Paraglaciecola sp. TaxID=1920173 RepID=UPI003EFB1741